MAKQKNSRKVLLLSLLSLLICCSVLVGTTFAWFTDSVTSSKNTILAGNLDVELYYTNDVTSTWTKVGSDTNVFKSDTLWEPGHTEVFKLKVANEGTLALRYKLGIAIATESGSRDKDGNEFLLSDHILYGVYEGDLNGSREEAIAAVADNALALKELYGSTKTLMANTVSDVVTVVVWMPETVGNEANYGKGETIPQIELGIQLEAFQLNHESDSFGSGYDRGHGLDLEYVYNIQDLVEKVEAGGEVYLGNSIVVDPEEMNTTAASIPTAIVLDCGEQVELDLNGYTVTLPDSGKQSALVYAYNTDVNISGDGKLTVEGEDNYGVWAKGNTTVNVESGTFETKDPDAFMMYASGGAVINIYGGTFISASSDPQRYANVQNFGVGRIYFYGGTFNWNPATDVDANDRGYICVAEGYKVVDNGNGTWSVVPE